MVDWSGLRSAPCYRLEALDGDGYDGDGYNGDDNIIVS